MAVFMVSTPFVKADFFDFNLKYLFLVGLWSNENWSPTLNRYYRIYVIILFLFSFTFITVTGIGMYMYKDDLMILLSNIDKCLVGYHYFIKIIIFYSKLKYFKILIAEIIHSGDKIADDRKKLMMMLVVIMSAISTLIIGLFQTLAHMKGEMAIDVWMPFDTKKNKWTLFIAGQISGIIFVVPVVYRAVAIQGIVCSIIMYMCDQLIELQDRLKALTYTVENESFMREMFKQIIKKHIRLMRYSQLMEWVFKEYFFIQNMAVTAELCLNALTLTNVGLELSFLACLVVALFNAYIFCHLGNELMDQSAGIALAAYESTWTSWPVDMQKDLLIVITVAQRNFKLSVGGIAVMSMETFAQALYNGYSVFAVLRDIVK